jgi:hypothetical protein
MKTKFLFLSGCLCISSMTTFSQIGISNTTLTDKRNQIGIQFNPLLDSNDDYVANIYSIRYGYRVRRPWTFGAEVSVFVFRPANYYGDYFSITPDIFCRYSFHTEKRFHLFLELSPFCQILYTKQGEYYGNQLGCAFSPGVSLFSKNGRFSTDLYYKISTSDALNGRTGALSYKINFHF